ncbi:hypothetical protein J7E83_17815 [Arthrobacter sp. ISL-48]|uniref:hypothetical protein n=1 Tax=Arthrobacter sp. ISL-48 TaxID=2819110 RepID=UPI001BEA9B46|nr:hypothetical protein [Arthrobacter sp. ISL-48]MBT2533948.1 hypothetical protein [Arthrobacter sp. ISL-48]
MSLLPTYENFVSEYAAAKPTTQIPPEAAWAMYEGEILRITREMQADGTVSRAALREVLAHESVRTHMGQDWYEANIRSIGPASRGYLYPDTEGTAARLISRHRVQQLGMRLHQLQAHPWFDRFLSHMSTSQLSGSAFEADILTALMAMPGQVVRTEEAGKRGQDFDISVNMGTRRIPVEVKTKDDDTPFSERTVVKTVKKASSQLPVGEQAVLFLRIPAAWIGPGLDEPYTDALFDATRQSSKIAAVITVVDKTHIHEGTSRGRVHRHYQPFKSPNGAEDLWKFALTLTQFLELDLTLLAPRLPF